MGNTYIKDKVNLTVKKDIQADDLPLS